MSRWLVASAALLLSGCANPSRLFDCPRWTAADSGFCRRRPWRLPKPGEGLGHAGAREPHVVVDTNGRAIVAFGSSAGVETLEETAGGWTLRRPGAGVGGTEPGDLVAGEGGTAAFAWLTLTRGYGTVYLSERDETGAWKDPGTPEEAFSFPSNGLAPRLAENRRGERLLVWNQWMSTPHYGVALARRASPHAPWQRPAGRDDVLSLPVFYVNTPVVALNDAGQGLITWYQSGGGPLRAWVSERAGSDGSFAHVREGDVLSPPGSPVDSDTVAGVKPAIAADGAAAAAWAQEDGKGAIAVYVATRTPSGAWTKPRDLDDAFGPARGHARGVQAAFGPGGDLYVLWYQDHEGGNAVYAARRRPDGVWAEDGRHPARLSSPGAAGLFPELAVGPGGSVVAVWSERVGKGPLRVAARRTGPAPEAWGPVEMLSPETGEDAVQPAVAVGPHDRVVAVWGQGPGAAQRVMVARVE